jgi:hypothetical protein
VIVWGLTCGVKVAVLGQRHELAEVRSRFVARVARVLEGDM